MKYDRDLFTVASTAIKPAVQKSDPWAHERVVKSRSSARTVPGYDPYNSIGRRLFARRP